MKVHELAKELGLKPGDIHDLSKKLGFEDLYKGISKEISPEDEIIIRDGFTRGEEEIDKEIAFVAENSKVKLVGMAYDDTTKTYRVADINIDLEQFNELGGKLGQSYGTVYNARMDFQILLDRKAGILSPNPLNTIERGRKK